ncbi:hypothetical protein BCAR13_1260022 [Paraburkholderia caribensis]|nr:hypothetical protein BCAR13_1260022 [Paraburkholderia caribensis]
MKTQARAPLPVTQAHAATSLKGLRRFGGPGGSRTHGVLSEADYESAACNQHGVRPNDASQWKLEKTNKKTRSEGRACPSIGRHTTRKQGFRDRFAEQNDREALTVYCV